MFQLILCIFSVWLIAVVAVGLIENSADNKADKEIKQNTEYYTNYNYRQKSWY